MVKSNKCKSFKRYLFAGSLILLFIVTLVMTSNVLAGCPDFREFTCTITETYGGETLNIWEEGCANLCVVNDYATLNPSVGGFSCQLIFLNGKNLLGIGTNATLGGCSVNFRGRSMTADFADPDIKHIYHLKCTPCDGCCPQ
jgi:hypothetical protein